MKPKFSIGNTVKLNAEQAKIAKDNGYGGDNHGSVFAVFENFKRASNLGLVVFCQRLVGKTGDDLPWYCFEASGGRYCIAAESDLEPTHPETD